jgi:hypothetical protein
MERNEGEIIARLVPAADFQIKRDGRIQWNDARPKPTEAARDAMWATILAERAIKEQAKRDLIPNLKSEYQTIEAMPKGTAAERDAYFNAKLAFHDKIMFKFVRDLSN